MKRPIHPISTRLGSVLLAACTIFSPLPLSAVTVAADTKPVTVTWGPQEQTEPGRRSVSLSADLQDGAYAAALVEVSLTEPEFSSLRKAWTGARVQESDLGSADGPYSIGPDTGDPYSIGPDAGATGGDSPQAVLI